MNVETITIRVEPEVAEWLRHQPQSIGKTVNMACRRMMTDLTTQQSSAVIEMKAALDELKASRVRLRKVLEGMDSTLRYVK